jgi:hypothetical protein
MLGRRMVARTPAFLAVLALVALAPSGRAAAQDLSSSCGTENLLAGRIPNAQAIRGNVALVTDGQVGPEGAQWDALVIVTFEL